MSRLKRWRRITRDGPPEGDCMPRPLTDQPHLILAVDLVICPARERY